MSGSGQLDVDVVRVEHDHLAERPWIDEQQLGRSERPRLRWLRRRSKVEHDVGVQRTGGARLDEEQLTGHPQVNHQGVSGVERAQQILPAAPGGDEGGARETVD
jgi:hypothetical protein